MLPVYFFCILNNGKIRVTGFVACYVVCYKEFHAIALPLLDFCNKILGDTIFTLPESTVQCQEYKYLV